MLIKWNAILFRKIFTCRPFELNSKAPGKASLQYHSQFKQICKKFLKLEFKKLPPRLYRTNNFRTYSPYPAHAALFVYHQLLHAIVNFSPKHPTILYDLETSIFTHTEAWQYFQIDHVWERDRALESDFAYQLKVSALSRPAFLFLGVTIFCLNPRAGVS